MSARNLKKLFLEHFISLFGNINWHSYSEDLTSQLTVLGHVEEPCVLEIPCLLPFEGDKLEQVAAVSNEMLQ
jgi:hypothetical protein